MRSSIRLGFALITLADWRATSALLLSNLETPGLVKAANGIISLTPVAQSLLHRAQTAVARALALEDIEAETRSAGQLVLAHIYYLKGSGESTTAGT